MLSSKTTGVIEDTEPMKKLPASSSSRGRTTSKDLSFNRGCINILVQSFLQLNGVHAASVRPSTSDLPQPVSVVAYLNSVKIQKTPACFGLHRRNRWNFSPWPLITKNAALKPDETAVTLPLDIQRAGIRRVVQRLVDDQPDMLCLRARRRKRTPFVESEVTINFFLRSSVWDPVSTHVYLTANLAARGTSPFAWLASKAFWLGKAHSSTVQLVDYFTHISSVAFSIVAEGVHSNLKLWGFTNHNSRTTLATSPTYVSAIDTVADQRSRNASMRSWLPRIQLCDMVIGKQDIW
ncbi:hypothetical protein EDD15DRAFT_2516158 [Pisolithus albus]|nr:hypothetical protein EDD15DRAFT_2516158 [Pisolithus albus]